MREVHSILKCTVAPGATAAGVCTSITVRSSALPSSGATYFSDGVMSVSAPSTTRMERTWM